MQSVWGVNYVVRFYVFIVGCFAFVLTVFMYLCVLIFTNI